MSQQLEPPLVRAANLNQILSNPPPIPTAPTDLTDDDVAGLMAALGEQSAERQAVTQMTPLQAMAAELAVLRYELAQARRDLAAAGKIPYRPKFSPLDQFIIGALIVIYGGVVYGYHYNAPAQVQTRQMDELIEQNRQLAARNSKLAEEALKRPSCSFAIVCPNR